MNQKLRTVFIFIALILVIGGASLAYSLLKDKTISNTKVIDSVLQTKITASDKLAAKVAAPDFTVTDQNGKQLLFSSLFGKPIVLNFWASWCPPCKSELPDFNKVYNEMKDDVVFLMVDLVDGQRETVATGSGYIAEQGYSFSVYYDTTQEAANTYSISSIPTTLFIDKDGNIAEGQTGMLDEDGLRKGISKINP